MITDSILMIHSNEFGWDSVRRSLERLTGAQASVETYDVFGTLNVVTGKRPKAVLASDTVGRESSYPLLVEVREHLGPHVPIAVFAGELDPISIHMFAALNLSGFFQWTELVDSDSVTTAVRAGLTSDVVCGTPALVYSCFQLSRRGVDSPVAYQPVSSRQREILRLLVAGHSQREISLLLHCSIRTVARDVDTMKESLQADNTYDLVMRATLLGMIP